MLLRTAAVLFVALLGSCDPGAAPEQEPPPRRAWTLVYFLPYDNDLDRHAEQILDALSAIEDDRVAVLALVDRRGPGGLSRVTITREGREVRRVDVEASVHPAVLGRLLDRAVADLPSERIALFLLDHGGRLDEIGLDQHPDGGPEWLSARRTVAEIAAWRRRSGRRLDLLMLQQCGRGSAETYHLLRDAADVLVASQGILAAPNGYYGPMLRAIAAGEAEDAAGLARAIIDGEPPEMFVEYTAVRSGALEDLPRQLDAAITPLLGNEAVADGTRGALASSLALSWGEDSYADLFLFLRGLYRALGIDAAPVDSLEQLVRSEVVLHRRTSSATPQATALGGLSLLVPASSAGVERLAYLPLHRASRLDDLLRRYPQDRPAAPPEAGPRGEAAN